MPDVNLTLKSDVNVVVVPVLVRDPHGHEVANLKKEDFEVFDNNKPQVISGFSILKHPRVGANTMAVAPLPLSPNVDARPSAIPERFVVFLFDDMHLSASDLAQTQKASVRILAGSLAESDMAAVVSISGRVNSGLTRDRTKLQESIKKLQPQGLSRVAGTECPDIDYYQADMIENKHSRQALESATDEVLSCSPALDRRDVAERLAEGAAMRVLEVSDQDVRMTLGSIREVLRRMIALPGQRTLILVSDGFLTITRDALTAESQIMDIAAQSNVTISALDARGVYTTELDATERTRGKAETMQLRSEYHRSSMGLNENVMAELADATGGAYFHNNNDLQAGLSRLTAAPEYLYLLYFSPKNTKQNGTYHRLKVKLLDQDGLKLQARQGYVSPKLARNKN